MPGPRPYRGKSGNNFSSRGRGSSGRFRGRGHFKSGSSTVNRTADGLVQEQTGDREGTDQQEKWNDAVQNHELDERLGFARFEDGPPRVGWLINIQPVSITLTFLPIPVNILLTDCFLVSTRHLSRMSL